MYNPQAQMIAMPQQQGAQVPPGYMMCMVPVGCFVPGPASGGAATGEAPQVQGQVLQQAQPMQTVAPADGSQGAPMHMWAVPMGAMPMQHAGHPPAPQGEDLRQRGQTGEQMVQGMWGSAPQQGFQAWNPNAMHMQPQQMQPQQMQPQPLPPQAQQQPHQQQHAAASSEPSRRRELGDASVAPFVPAAQRAEAASFASQLSASAKPFEKASEPERKKRGLIKNMRLERGAAAGAGVGTGGGAANNDSSVDAHGDGSAVDCSADGQNAPAVHQQPMATGQPIVTKDKAGVSDKMKLAASISKFNSKTAANPVSQHNTISALHLESARIFQKAPVADRHQGGKEGRPAVNTPEVENVAVSGQVTADETPVGAKHAEAGGVKAEEAAATKAYPTAWGRGSAVAAAAELSAAPLPASNAQQKAWGKGASTGSQQAGAKGGPVQAQQAGQRGWEKPGVSTAPNQHSQHQQPAQRPAQQVDPKMGQQVRAEQQQQASQGQRGGWGKGSGKQQAPPQKAVAAAPVKAASEKKEEEEAKPLAAHEFPSLISAAKPKKGPKKTGKQALEVSEAPEEKPPEPVSEKKPLVNSAWGKAGEEARKKAAEQKKAEAAKAAEEAAARAAEGAKAAEEAAKLQAEQEAAAQTTVEEPAEAEADAEETAAQAEVDELAEAEAEADEEQACQDEEDVAVSAEPEQLEEQPAETEDRPADAEEEKPFEADDKAEEKKPEEVVEDEGEEQNNEEKEDEHEEYEEKEDEEETEEAARDAKADTQDAVAVKEDSGEDDQTEEMKEDVESDEEEKELESPSLDTAAKETAKTEADSGKNADTEVADEEDDRDTKEDDDDAVQEEEEEEDEEEEDASDAVVKDDAEDAEVDVEAEQNSDQRVEAEESMEVDTPAKSADTFPMDALMKFRFIESEVPEEFSNFVAQDHEIGYKETSFQADRNDRDRAGKEVPSDRSIFGSQRATKEDKWDRGDRRRGGRDRDRDRDRDKDRDKDREIRRDPVEKLEVSANAYRPRRAAPVAGDRNAELKRCANSLLNKVCPENIKAIAERIKAEAEVRTVEELELVIGLIFRKALAEPHYCKTYADLVVFLKGEMPEFPREGGGKPVTFKSTLLNVCQAEFESMPKTLEPSADDLATCDQEELDFRMSQKKGKFLANMKFIGNLFLRQMLTTKIIATVMQDLMKCDGGADEVPEEHVVECICELLSEIGYTLESTPAGKASIQQVCGRMLDLKTRKRSNGKGLLSKRIQFNIQDVLDMRQAGWAKKVFKATAKTKDEIRQEQERDQQAQERGKAVAVGEVVIAGQRSSLQEQPAAAPKEAGAGSEWQETRRRR